MTTLLLVEDNELNRDMQVRRLERKGFEVLIAMDGQQGVEVATAKLPDLILMDLNLPVMDGWEATRRIKAQEAHKHIPVIAVTSHAMIGEESRARDAGCDAYLPKPIDEEELFEKIHSFLSK